MNVKKHLNNKGSSLVEIMVSTAIFVFIGAGLLTVLVATNKFMAQHEATLASQRAIRNTFDQLTQDMREANSVSVTTETSPNNTVTIDFSIPDEGSIAITWTDDSSNSNANRVLRTVGADSRIIAQNISAMTVTDATNDITVNMTASNQAVLGNVSAIQLVKKINKR